MVANVRILIKDTPSEVGESVTLKGWVNSVRDHGKLVFLDLRDRSGIVQVVGSKEVFGDLGSEYVLEVTGKVKERPEKLVNKDIATGKIEIAAESVAVLTKARVLPFDIYGDGHEIDDKLRLKYRYLDLRRPRLAGSVRLRHKVIQYMRNFLQEKGFVEIETPILTKATPEGARDFLVPSRLHQGEVYALPQSPQQYKQLLMVAGFERYFQIARCFRDEDPRADRQLEFTQLDIELSFPTQEEILSLTEELYIEIVEKLTTKKIWKKPFPRLSYHEVMEKYGTDKPDLRPDKTDKDMLAFAFIVDWPLFLKSEQTGKWESAHHPFTAPRDEDVPLLAKEGSIGQVRSWQHDFVCNGFEVGGGSIRITDPKVQTRIFEILGHKRPEIERKFGHLLEAFEYGVPPHGGIAPGVDRLVALLRNEYEPGQLNIKEVMAFPVSSKGITAVMEAPSKPDPEQLKELGLVFKESK
jgi:aspartyl-tRNA synthetase